MTTRRPRRPFGMARSRRKTSWFDVTVNVDTLLSGQQVSSVLTTNMGDDEKYGATIIRTIVPLSVNMTVASSGGIVSLGIVMVNQDAQAAQAMPDPEADLDQPGWMWRTRRVVSSSLVNDQSQALFIFADLKVSRKFAGEEVDSVLIMGYSGVDSINIDGLVRTLVLRP